MFNNLGFKIKVVATVFASIALVVVVVCIIAGGVLLISGHVADLSLKILVVCVATGAILWFVSMMIYGFGHIIDMQEEQTLLLRKIAQDEESSYDKMNNNVFVE